jgi:hypothetical protein
VFSGISLNQLIAGELNRTIAAKLYMNTNSGTLPLKAIAGYSARFKTLVYIGEVVVHGRH